MQISQSVKLACIVVLLIAIYFLGRGLIGGPSQKAEDAPSNQAFAVAVEAVNPEIWADKVVIRGRTKAESNVVVRAETAGVVAETPAVLGAMVAEGDVLCRLNIDARAARLAEAQAAFSRAELDYAAAVKLKDSGFRSETGVAAAKAARDQAAAQVKQAQLELSKTNIVAPFDGVFDARFAEAGDFLAVGDPCGTVIKANPFLVVGSVPERSVGKIKRGDKGVASLATGQTINGAVRFVGSAADPATRTFTVELEIPNPDGLLKDGVTAEFTVFAENSEAFHVPRSAIILNDDGEIGVKTASDAGIVSFHKITLLGEDASGIWVGGLSGPMNLIVRGQEYVAAGERVEIHAAPQGISGEAS